MQNHIKMLHSVIKASVVYKNSGRTMWAKISLKYLLTEDLNLLNCDLNSSLFKPFWQFCNYFMNYRRPPF